MKTPLPLLSLLSLTLSSTTLALGINCRGAFGCGADLEDFSLGDLISAASSIDDNRVWQNGQHAACATGSVDLNAICAFPQGTANGIAGWKIKQLLGFLQTHGCTRCGSVPLNFPNDNDVDDAGMLTVNYVT